MKMLSLTMEGRVCVGVEVWVGGGEVGGGGGGGVYV